mmetsp:Transcript_45490/g.86982  ORF Transcript_45490/g.86982 Transcript_45490/m.86982 type:complete len:389 (-) Transcript_45490:656-1822(-)
MHCPGLWRFHLNFQILVFMMQLRCNPFVKSLCRDWLLQRRCQLALARTPPPASLLVRRTLRSFLLPSDQQRVQVYGFHLDVARRFVHRLRLQDAPSLHLVYGLLRRPGGRAVLARPASGHNGSCWMGAPLAHDARVARLLRVLRSGGGNTSRRSFRAGFRSGGGRWGFDSGLGIGSRRRFERRLGRRFASIGCHGTPAVIGRVAGGGPRRFVPMGVLRTRRLGTQVLGKERVHVNADRVALAPAGAGLKPNGDPPRGAEVGGLGAVEAVVVPRVVRSWEVDDELARTLRDAHHGDVVLLEEAGGDDELLVAEKLRARPRQVRHQRVHQGLEAAAGGGRDGEPALGAAEVEVVYAVEVHVLCVPGEGAAPHAKVEVGGGDSGDEDTLRV